MVNYPSVNDAHGRAYTERDLQKCGSAVVKSLLEKSKHFPQGIPAKDISIYGNCLGSMVAERTYQDLLAQGIPIARRILSNGYGNYARGIRVFLCTWYNPRLLKLFRAKVYTQ